MDDAELRTIYTVAALSTLFLAKLAVLAWCFCRPACTGAGESFGPPQERDADDWELGKGSTGSMSTCGGVPAATLSDGVLVGDGELLCGELMVPHGLEMVLLIPLALAGRPQQDSFFILNSNGEPLGSMSFDEVSPRRAGVHLQALDGRSLAFVSTRGLFSEPRCPPEIRRPCGRAFGHVVAAATSAPAGGECEYVVSCPPGQPPLAVKGDFREMTLSVEDPQGQLVCVTRPIEPKEQHGEHSGAKLPLLEARVRGADAGLVLCALVAAGKAEAVAAAAVGAER